MPQHLSRQDTQPTCRINFSEPDRLEHLSATLGTKQRHKLGVAAHLAHPVTEPLRRHGCVAPRRRGARQAPDAARPQSLGALGALGEDEESGESHGLVGDGRDAG